jgi:serine protease Do
MTSIRPADHRFRQEQLNPIPCTEAPPTPVSHRDTPVVDVVRQNGPLVVNIRTEAVADLREIPEWGQYGKQLDQFFQEYFGDAYSNGTLKYKSIGSGVILNNDGIIVTNAHVIEKAKSIYVVLSDSTVLVAETVKVDRSQDLALVQVDLPSPITPLAMADFDRIMIGETVVAIGDPLGFENSVTVGVISGKNREFSSRECRYECSGLLQTDASINPGNSGGALLNLDGELVGINLAVVQNAQNIGFAIPANKIQRLVDSLQEPGR